MFGFQSQEGFLEAETAWSGKIKWCTDTPKRSCGTEALGRQWSLFFFIGRNRCLCCWGMGGEVPWAPKGVSQNLKENSTVRKCRQRDVCVFTISHGSVYLLWSLKWRMTAFETVCEVCAFSDSTLWDPGERSCHSDVDCNRALGKSVSKTWGFSSNCRVCAGVSLYRREKRLPGDPRQSGKLQSVFVWKQTEALREAHKRYI